MKRNVTVKLDDELLKEARILAATRGTSLSAMLGDVLEQHVRAEGAYEEARLRAVERLRRGMDLHWRRPRSRGELHADVSTLWSEDLNDGQSYGSVRVLNPLLDS